ncbi:hypothetical protein PPL_00752 [Heterostelium album PN500]|uniref:Uncharacterized protein n=1 Tax=Heterostelium pallidum (strain ATCC 26659 / Pp 5 / PN500) TaxID=670386 RepID=D3AXC1_HETP5|nr:hypothetical protein PPL_00752 [Heterostelium album PN500]EFA86190.1 hypothetical protein PPL_00752 [Heterostelium album PN500]|eukprot:XP_020438295.1 hypothetical protein PPL_00752 [Heterostelium album PN500]
MRMCVDHIAKIHFRLFFRSANIMKNRLLKTGQALRIKDSHVTSAIGSQLTVLYNREFQISQTFNSNEIFIGQC